MRKTMFLFGLLAIMLVFGIMVVGCASYYDLMDRTTPGWRTQEPIKVFPGDSGGGKSGGGSSGGGNSSSGGGSSGGSSSSSGGSSSEAQQPTNTDITRTYSFNIPTSGQAGGGASAMAKAEAEADAQVMFQRENPGYEIRRTSSQFDGLGTTLTVTIIGRKKN